MRALVTGIKPYFARLAPKWADHHERRFEGFEAIRTKAQLIEATRFNGNTGNYFVGEGAIEAVGRDKATFGNFGYLRAKTKDSDYLAMINAQFDCVVFVTANLLRSDYDATAEAELFSKLTLPIVVLGIGCQRVRDLPASLPQGTLQFIDVLKSKEHHVFARGRPTANYLRQQGLTQVWPTGCPSLFIRPDHVVAAVRRLTRMDWNSELRMAFSGYLGRDLTAVRDIKVFPNRARGSTYFLQDEYFHYGMEFDAEDDDVVYNDMSGELGRLSPFSGCDAILDVGKRVFFNTHQWRGVISTHEVALGRRFHGVVAALQTGVPGLMIANDDRMREMLMQFGLPYIDAAEWGATDDRIALLNKTTSEFDADQWADQYVAAADRFHVRMAKLGLGDDSGGAGQRRSKSPDVALGKPALSSSVSRWSRHQDPKRDASGANGESLAEDYGFHTQRENNPWWMVDLLAPHRVHEIAIVNRRNECERFRSFRIETSLDAVDWTMCYSTTEPFDVSADPRRPWLLRLENSLPARYVRIVLIGEGPLHLRRIQVFGRREPAATG